MYVCTIPAAPPSLNVWMRWHWAKQEREKQKWWEMVWAIINEKGNKCPRGLEAIEVHAVITVTTKRGRDSDNFLTPLNKWTQDALTSAGVVPDDTADRCTFYPPKLAPGKVESTLLMIEEVRREHEQSGED